MTKKVRGFFTKEEPKKLRKKGKSKQAKDPCEVCGLYRQAITPKMEAHGNGRRKILHVAEGPGKTEDREGEQLIGDAGQLYEEELYKVGIDLHEDGWKINAVNCRPPGNRKPTKKEIKCCKWMVQKTIDQYHPKFIFLLGNAALDSFYAGRFSENTISRWRRLCIPDRDTNAWIIPLYHPSYILRNRDDENLRALYRKDLKFAASCLTKTMPTFQDFGKDVKIVKDFDFLMEFFEELLRERQITIAIDYEATSLKPYGYGQKIWSCAIAPHNGLSISFPVSYPFWEPKEEEAIKNMLVKILWAKNIKKVAHNLKFEDMWSRGILGDVRGWHWCTMNAAHILDCRKKYTGLKFQGYINFGCEDYAKDVKKYMTTTRPGSNINILDQYPLDKLLRYNGIDALLTYHLYEKQYRILNRQGDPRTKAYSFFHQGLLALSDATHQGICMDEPYYIAEDEKLKVRLTDIEDSIFTSKEAKKFERVTGKKFEIGNKDFSASDLRTMFFDVLKQKSTKETATGLKKIDKDVLSDLNHPFAEKIVARRKLYKLKNTYLAQFLREIQDGKMHPFLDLHTARTYRSSSSLPNFHNVPVREEEAKAITRKGVKPSPGYKIACVDYGSIEVRIAACYTLDPVLIDYIFDTSTDMHRDQGMEIFLLSEDEITKVIRFYTKNQFVFPEFYGSYFKSCAQNLWDNCILLDTQSGIPLYDHLNERLFRGMPVKQHYQIFENHVKRVETKFWKKFHVFREWQEKMVAEYQKRGYIQMFMGHQRNDRMTRNRIFNSAIQGTAFHCLLWSLIKLNKISKRRKWKTKIIGQIHDEIVYDLHPKEQDMVLETTRRVMTEDIRKEHPWIIVPLVIEPEVTPIDGAWYYIKEVKGYDG
jgi:DNA polymerase-1